MKANQPSAGAMRVKNAFVAHLKAYNFPPADSHFMEMVDRETALPELVDVAKKARLFMCAVTPETQRALDEALEALRKAGVEI